MAITRKNIIQKYSSTIITTHRLLYFSIFFICCGACADTMPIPAIYHQSFITLDGDLPIKPLAIAQSADGGFVIAGNAGTIAWASKTDAHGNTLWNYTGPSESNEQAISGLRRFYPEFLGAAPMPDGSSYLCGYKPGTPKSYAPGLIVHLDAQGRVITEQLITPQNRPQIGIARLDRCSQWGDGVVLQGHLLDWTQGLNGAFSRNDLYWLIALDAAGHVRWERNFPMAPELAGSDEFSPLAIMADSSVVASSTKNDNTELVRFNHSGELLASHKISGFFQIINPSVPSNIIHVLGWVRGDAGIKMIIISLDKDFNEIGRIEGRSTTFLTRTAFELPDQSILLFGSRAHNFGEVYTSQITHIAPALLSENSLDLPRSRPPFFDSGSIWAAARNGTGGQFVSARGLSIAPDSNDSNSNGLPQGFRRGAELDFVLIK